MPNLLKSTSGRHKIDLDAKIMIVTRSTRWKSYAINNEDFQWCIENEYGIKLIRKGLNEIFSWDFISNLDDIEPWKPGSNYFVVDEDFVVRTLASMEAGIEPNSEPEPEPTVIPDPEPELTRPILTPANRAWFITDLQTGDFVRNSNSNMPLPFTLKYSANVHIKTKLKDTERYVPELCGIVRLDASASSR